MIIFKHPADIQAYLSGKREEGLSTGFVPTMGALHNGHIGLITRARAENQLVICSIFVNPTQFNDPKDFEKYPSTIENDLLQLEKAGCDVVFLPSVADIYPQGIQATKHYDLGHLETILEGEFRPGHFQGVCQVVNRLLDIVAPDKLYLGQKDFQQCMVLTKMIELLGIETEIVICPTLREPDGLAMSSRNLRLSEYERKKAPAIYEALSAIKNDLRSGVLENLTGNAKKLLAEKGFKVDYVEIATTGKLEIVRHWDGQTGLVALCAAFLGDVRLIDNLIL